MGGCNEIWKCVLNMMRCHYLRQLVELTYVVVRLGVGGLGVSLIGDHGGDQKGDNDELKQVCVSVIFNLSISIPLEGSELLTFML